MSTKSDNNIKDVVLKHLMSKMEPFTLKELSELVYNQSFDLLGYDKKFELETSLKQLISENKCETHSFEKKGVSSNLEVFWVNIDSFLDRLSSDSLIEISKWLDEEISLQNRSGNPNKKVYIEKLHLYNELKDAGQILLGKIATIDQVTTRSLYKKYEIDLND